MLDDWSIVTVNRNSYVPYARVRAGTYSSLKVVLTVGSTEIGIEHVDVQLVMVQRVVAARERSHRNWMLELMKKS